MNKKYFKRQLTLDKLGIPMDEDIKECYEYFNSLININEIEKFTHDDYPDIVFYKKYGKVILEYDNINLEYIFVDYDSIWKKFEMKYNFDFKDIHNLLLCMFNYYLGLDLKTIVYVTDEMKRNSWAKLSK